VHYQILIISCTTIPDTTGHQMIIQVSPHQTCASALPGKLKTHKIGIKMNKKRQKIFVTLVIVTWRRIMRF